MATTKKKKLTKEEKENQSFLGSHDALSATAALIEAGTPLTKDKALETLEMVCGLDAAQASKLLERLGRAGVFAVNAKGMCKVACYGGLRRGVLGYTRMGRAYVTFEEEGDRAYLPDDLYDLLPGDVVWVDGVDRFVLLARREKRTWVCSCSRGGRRRATAAHPLGSNVPTIDIIGNRKVFEGELEEGDLVELELTPECMVPTNDPYMHLKGKLTNVLGTSDDARAQILATSARFEVPYEFSPQTLDEAQALPETVDTDAEISSRVDLRDIGFVTIDGEDAKDFDDAVWCRRNLDGSWRLLVAIADVSHYVTPGSALDKDAQQRSTSVYFPGFVIPMLPEKLSNGLCSLNPGVDRCTMVCDMIVGTDGLVSAYQFYPALIHSKARLTYTCVWNALQGDADELSKRGGVLSDVSELYALYKAFAAARKSRHAINFETREMQIVLSEDRNRAEAIMPREHNDAHRLIEECMLAANTCAADFLLRHKTVCLMRVHDKPSAEKLLSTRAVLASWRLTLGGGDSPTASDYEKVLAAVKGKSYAGRIQEVLLRSMQQAQYSPDNIGHYGLNYPAYTHFTSPIRRYPDLLVHRTIRSILLKKKYQPEIFVDDAAARESRTGQQMIEAQKKADQARGAKAPRKGSSLELWRRLGIICSAAERRAENAAHDIEAWYKACYIARYIGKDFKAVITGVIPSGVFVTLTNLYVDGFVHVSRLGHEFYVYDEQKSSFIGEDTGRTFRVGGELKVTVVDVDVEARKVDFRCV